MITELFLLTTLAGGATAQATKIDPCALVTKPELQAAIEGKHKADELARLKAKGITWTITTESAHAANTTGGNVGATRGHNIPIVRATFLSCGLYHGMYAS